MTFDADAPARPFVDRPIGDLEVATSAALHAADVWDLERPVLLRCSMNAVFAAGATVLRVSTPTVDASASIRLAEVLIELGLRVPTPLRHDSVVFEGVSVTCWERIEPAPIPIDWVAVGRMLRTLHDVDPASLPSEFPLPSPADFPWWNFDRLFAEVGDHLDDDARRGIEAAIERHLGWEQFGQVVVCHGDVHPGNVVAGPDGPVLLDWDLACLAHPGWDHAPMMTWAQRWGGDEGDYARLAAGYGRSMYGEPAAEAFAELRLVAATLMRLKAALTDDAAMPEAQRRLAYWRGDSDAPAWQAQ